MSRVTAAWERFWFAPEPTSSLALFRIAIGMISFAWALSLLPDFHAFFSSDGVEPVPPQYLATGAWGVLNTFPSYSVAVALLVALLVASLCLTVGYRTRLASVVAFVAVISFEQRAPSIWNSGDGVLRILLFFLMFAPAGASLSVDRWRKDRDGFWEFPARPHWALRLVQIQVSVVYLSSVWFKLHSERWLDGTAVSFAVRVDDLQRFGVPGVLSDSMLFSSVMTWWTLAIELMIGILVWNRAARPYVLALGVGLHLLVGFNLRLGFFSETMIAAYLAFLSPAAATAVILSVRNSLRRAASRVHGPQREARTPAATRARIERTRMTTVADRPHVVDTAPAPAPPQAARRRRWWMPALAAAPPTALVALHATRYGHWIVDDAGITFAYARSLASGAGPVLQPGADPVEAFSSPAWTAILVVGRWLGLFDTGTWSGVPDLVLFPKLVALLCVFGMFCCFFSVVAAVRNRHVALVSIAAGLATALVPSFVIWTMSGLENSLFALAVVALAAALVRAAQAGELLTRRTAVVCGALAALAALTRPDGLIYATVYPIALLVLHRGAGRRAARMIAVSFAAAFAPVVAYVVWRVVTFASLLPNTAVAKQQGLPSLSDFNKATDLLTYAGWLVTVLVVTVVVIALRRPTGIRTPLVVLLIPLGLAVFSYCVLENDWMAQLRFTTPVWPLVALLAALSLADLLDRADRRTRVAAAAVLVVAALLTVPVSDERSEAFASHPTASLCGVARNTGLTFNTYADRLEIDDGSLLAVDGGGTSLTTRLRFVDFSGLADQRIAEYWADRDMAGLRDHVFKNVRPTFIRIWLGWDGVAPTQILDDHRLQRDYVLIWGPNEGGGNWVRREAVTNPTQLEDLQAAAPGLAAAVDAPWARGATSWWCGPSLTPSEPGDDPLTTLPT